MAKITALFCFLAFAHSAFGEQIDNSINAEQQDIGKIQTQIQKYESALGVVSQLMRIRRSQYRMQWPLLLSEWEQKCDVVLWPQKNL